MPCGCIPGTARSEEAAARLECLFLPWSGKAHPWMSETLIVAPGVRGADGRSGCGMALTILQGR